MKKNANLPALIFMFARLIVWQCIAMGMNAAYILPSPTQVLVRLWELRKPLFTAHLPATMLCTGVGLAISIALGLLLAIVMDASPSAEKMLSSSLHRPFRQPHLRRCLCSGSATRSGARCSSPCSSRSSRSQ